MTLYKRRLPLRETLTSPTLRSTPRCLETWGCGHPNELTIQVTSRSHLSAVAPASNDSNSRRRGSAIALNASVVVGARAMLNHIPIREYVKVIQSVKVEILTLASRWRPKTIIHGVRTPLFHRLGHVGLSRLHPRNSYWTLGGSQQGHFAGPPYPVTAPSTRSERREIGKQPGPRFCPSGRRCHAAQRLEDWTPARTPELPVKTHGFVRPCSETQGLQGAADNPRPFAAPPRMNSHRRTCHRLIHRPGADSAGTHFQGLCRRPLILHQRSAIFLQGRSAGFGRQHARQGFALLAVLAQRQPRGHGAVRVGQPAPSLRDLS